MAIKKVNKAEELEKKTKGQTVLLNQPEHKKAIQEMNKVMEAVRRDYKIKESKSQASAFKVILTS